jgi:hypothetical protein
MTPSPPGLDEQIAEVERWLTSVRKVNTTAPAIRKLQEQHRDETEPMYTAILSTLRAHAELEADARRYRWLLRNANQTVDGGTGWCGFSFAFKREWRTRISMNASDMIGAAIDSSLGSK